MKYKILGINEYSEKNLDLYDLDSISDYLEENEYNTEWIYKDGYALIIDHVGSMSEPKSEKIKKERDKKIDIIINDGK